MVHARYDDCIGNLIKKYIIWHKSVNSISLKYCLNSMLFIYLPQISRKCTVDKIFDCEVSQLTIIFQSSIYCRRREEYWFVFQISIDAILSTVKIIVYSHENVFYQGMLVVRFIQMKMNNGCSRGRTDETCSYEKLCRKKGIITIIPFFYFFHNNSSQFSRTKAAAWLKSAKSIAVGTDAAKARTRKLGCFTTVYENLEENCRRLKERD